MPTGSELAQAIRSTQAELASLCAGIDEAAADRAPEGRWSPREILSHLAGAGQGGIVPLLQRILDEDMPNIDLHPGQTQLDEERRAMPFKQLAALVAQRYEAAARFAEGLDAEQLARPAHIPALAQSPLTEHPTLGALIGGFGQYHVHMHIEHLREVLAGKPAS
jgi:hypothetical protein